MAVIRWAGLGVGGILVILTCASVFDPNIGFLRLTS